MASKGQDDHHGPLGQKPQTRAAPSLQTSNFRSPNPRYSYTDTPLEMQQPTFAHPLTNPTNSTIEESPISTTSPSSRMLPDYSAGGDKAPVRLEKQHAPSSSELHPAFFAPYEDTKNDRGYHNGQQQQQQLYQQHFQEPDTAPHSHAHSSGQITSSSKQRKEPHQQAPTAPVTLTSPGGTTSVPSLQSSNEQKPPLIKKHTIEPDASFPAPPIDPSHIDASSHRPGQVSHPNSQTSHHFHHSLCDPSPTCCTALFCPCLVYGKTMHRISRKTARQDPTDLLGYDSCNASCGLFALACGFQWVLACIQRTRLRKIYGIEGSVGDDCIKATCCTCCVLAQDETELRDRESLMRRYQGPASAAYAAPGGMAYAPPPK